MAGHSKRHNIKHKKAITDAKKSKIYAKIAKLIEIAAAKGADPLMNPSLATVLIKAKYSSLPKEVIEKAIKKWSGQTNAEQYSELFYEGYGPSGTALYIKCLTTNVNRSASAIRSLLTKAGGQMSDPGTVARQFRQEGAVTITGVDQTILSKGKTIVSIVSFNPETLEEYLLGLSVLDYTLDGDVCTITTTREDLIAVTQSLESAFYHIEESDLIYRSDMCIELDEKDYEQFERIIELLEDDDDVEAVYHNVA